MENLNLVPILKNHIGETFYCTVLGYVKLVNINEDEDVYQIEIGPINNPNYIEYLTKEGKAYTEKESECILFPSKSNRDWNTFNKRWRAEKGGKYYFVITPLSKPAYVQSDIDNYEELTDSSNNINLDIYLSGNYFKTEKEAQIVADEINKLFNRK